MSMPCCPSAGSRFHALGPLSRCPPCCAPTVPSQVREVYWRVYNNLYIGAQDALVAFYPRLVDLDDKNTYQRYELDLML